MRKLSLARAEGFTLVEMMVVITIIMILSSLMVVGLARAQKQAKTLLCANNLRQIGSVVISYAHKNGGFFPMFGFRDQIMKLKPEIGLSGEDVRVSDTWVWELDFIDRPEDRYYSVQAQNKIMPPRMAPPVMRCPSDVQMFINGQSMLTSYWLHFYLSFTQYATITKRSTTALAFEADALNESNPANCGCRFHSTYAPKEIDNTHFGGSHILFSDGSVKLITNKLERPIKYWEDLAGWPDCTFP